MQGSLDDPPIVLQAKRWTPRQFQRLGVTLLVIGIVGFDGFGLPKPNLYLLVPLGLLAVFILVNRLFYVIRPGRLVIAPEGLTLQMAWRTRRWAWDAVQDFRPISVARVQSVGFDFVDKAKRTAVRQTNVNLAGVEGALPAVFDIDASEFAGLLNHARERWANRKAAPLPAIKTQTLLGRALSFYYVLVVGRLSGRVLWISLGVVTVVTVLAGAGLQSSWGASTWLMMASLFLCRARCRDIGWPGWLGFLLVPVWLAGVVVGLIFSTDMLYANAGASAAVVIANIVLGFIKGDPNPNRYGMPPGGVAQPIDQVFS